MTKIGIITGSTRDARINKQVVEYLVTKTNANEDAEFEVIDIKDYGFDLFNEATPPAMANKNYENETVQKWSDKIESLDGFIFVTPEYNKSVTPSLKNALDHIGPEFSNKAAGIVSYGSTLGIAASLSLREILSNFNVAVVGPAGAFSLFTDFQNMAEFTPSDVHEPTIKSVIETTVAWADALKAVRN